jgi:hypothetical protein
MFPLSGVGETSIVSLCHIYKYKISCRPSERVLDGAEYKPTSKFGVQTSSVLVISVSNESSPYNVSGKRMATATAGDQKRESTCKCCNRILRASVGAAAHRGRTDGESGILVIKFAKAATLRPNSSHQGGPNLGYQLQGHLSPIQRSLLVAGLRKRQK